MTLYSTDFIAKVFYKLKDAWQMFYLTLSDKEITSPIQNLCELLEIIDNQSLSKKIIDFEDAWKQISIPESLLPQTHPIESILEVWANYQKLEARLISNNSVTS
jgi:hypothetical protein